MKHPSDLTKLHLICQKMLWVKLKPFKLVALVRAVKETGQLFKKVFRYKPKSRTSCRSDESRLLFQTTQQDQACSLSEAMIKQ